LISTKALPQTLLGSLQHSPDSLAGFKGAYFCGGKGAEGKGRKGRERVKR